MPNAAATMLHGYRVREGNRATTERCLSWLGDLDSNQGCPVQSRKFYR